MQRGEFIKSFTVYEERKFSNDINISEVINTIDRNIENSYIKDECESYIEIKNSGKIIDLDEIEENKNIELLYNNLVVSISNAEITKNINN